MTPIRLAWKTVVCLFVGLAAALPAKAALLLTVDISNPAAVTFTATGDNSAFDVDGTATFPIQLKDFFSLSPTVETITASSSSLQTANADHNLTSALSGRAIPGSQTLVLRNGLDTERFSTTRPAFSGVATFDLSTLSTALPSVGFVGDVFVSPTGDASGSIIGTYNVVSAVPEPSSYALMAGVAALGFVLVLRRKRISFTASC